MELWAKKRPIEGYGQKYEFITHLDLQQIYSETDKLDREVYQECMVIEDQRCIFYREFEKTYVKRRIK